MSYVTRQIKIFVIKIKMLYILIVILIIALITLSVFMAKRKCKPYTQTLKTYRTEEKSGTVKNSNTADLEGQVYYTGALVANRHEDWADRVMTEYDIEFIPTNKCQGSDTPYSDQNFCPPFGLYAKCNPGGCANKTRCEQDVDCPGVGGVCTNGKCVCCSPEAKCKQDRDCGTGDCVNGKCSCDSINQTYACNVTQYPPYTRDYGFLNGVGAVAAPVDESVIEAAGDTWVAGGTWYSFPAESQCTENQELGDGGCTWKQVGTPKSLTLKQLGEEGFKFYCKDGDFCFSKDVVAKNQLENLRVLQRLFPDGVQPIHCVPKDGPPEPLETIRPRVTFSHAGMSAEEVHL